MSNEIMVQDENFNKLSNIANTMFEENYLLNKIIECYGETKAKGQIIAWGNVFSNIDCQIINKDTKQTLGDAINKSNRLKRQLIEEISKLIEKGVEMDSRNFYCAPHDIGKPNEKLEINFMVGYKKDILHKMGVYIVNMGVVYDGDDYCIKQNDKGQQYPYHCCKNIMKVIATTKFNISDLIKQIKFGYVCYKYKEEQRILTIPKEQIKISLEKTANDKNFSIKLNALGVYGAIEVILWKKLFNEVIYNDVAYDYEFEKNVRSNVNNEQLAQERFKAKAMAKYSQNKAENDEKKSTNDTEDKTMQEAEKVDSKTKYETLKDLIISAKNDQTRLDKAKEYCSSCADLTEKEKKDLTCLIDECLNQIAVKSFNS